MSLPPILASTLRLPVIGAPLFIISNPDLVLAQIKAGIVGSFPALNARPASLLDEWLARITEERAAYDAAHPDAPTAPFAVNQIVHRSNERLEQDVALCVKYKVPVIITSLGARADVCEAIHSYGGIVLHDVINVGFARKAVEKGARSRPSRWSPKSGSGSMARWRSPGRLPPAAASWPPRQRVRMSPTSARPSSPRMRRMRWRRTSRRSSTARRRTSSTATCFRAFTAIT
jgi:hypothetical protein